MKFENLSQYIKNENSGIVLYLHDDNDDNYVFFVGSAEFNLDLKTLKISDIRNHLQPSKHNNGLGSYGLNLYLNYLKELGFEYVTGDIVDWDDIDKLTYFYRKNGFKVVCNHKAKIGEISMNLREIHSVRSKLNRFLMIFKGWHFRP